MWWQIYLTTHTVTIIIIIKWLPSVRTCGSRHTGQAAPPHENIQFYSKNTTGFITNVINVTVSSPDKEVQFLIDELKKIYNTFIKQYEKKEA